MSSLLQNTIDLGSRSTSERTRERATKIIAQERVQHWIDCTVGVAEDRDQLVEHHQPGCHSLDVQHDDLEQPARQQQVSR